MRKVSLVSSDGIVTSFQRSILSFHSPMLARFVEQQNYEMPTHKQTKNKQYIYRLMLGASNGNSTRVAINVPTTQNALVCLLNALALFSSVVLLPPTEYSELGLIGLWFNEPMLFGLFREPKDLCLTMPLLTLPTLGMAGCLN